MRTIKVVQYGLGPIGLGIFETFLSRPWVQLVGAIDTDRSKVGKDAGLLLETPRKIGVGVSDKATPAIIANALPKIKRLEPGLRTMLDLPPISPCLGITENDRSVILKTF